MNSTTQDNSLQLKFLIVIALIFLAAVSRVFLHIPGFSPLMAIGLFGAAYFKNKWQALLIPIAATWLSDLLINNFVLGNYYDHFVWLYPGFQWQYLSYIAIILFGVLLFKKVNSSRVVFGAFSASILFYLISNFGVWMSGTMYPMNIEGLTACYIAGIPFIKGLLLGNLFYCGVLFGTYYWIQKQFPRLQSSWVRI